MITFNNVSKTYRTDFWAKSFYALDGVSFKINAGDLIGFLGANGAGKTTSIKILMKFIRARNGEVIYGPKLGNNFRDIFSCIGYIPERPYFYPHLTGLEFVTYMGGLNDIPRNIIKERINKWSERFLIAHALNRKISGYSKGMLQRIGFVAALVHDPLLLVLDEPLSGLDPIGRKEIKDCLTELHSQGKTIFFSSHIVPDVEEICNKVIVLEKGKLVYEGAIDKLIEDNIRPNYIIRLADHDKLQPPSYSKLLMESQFEVPSAQRESFLQDALAQGCKIISVQQDRPSLEQIIYKIRS